MTQKHLIRLKTNVGDTGAEGAEDAVELRGGLWEHSLLAMNDDAVRSSIAVPQSRASFAPTGASKLCSHRSAGCAVPSDTGFDCRYLRRGATGCLEQHQVFSRNANAHFGTDQMIRMTWEDRFQLCAGR